LFDYVFLTWYFIFSLIILFKEMFCGVLQFGVDVISQS